MSLGRGGGNDQSQGAKPSLGAEQLPDSGDLRTPVLDDPGCGTCGHKCSEHGDFPPHRCLEEFGDGVDVDMCFCEQFLASVREMEQR